MAAPEFVHTIKIGVAQKPQAARKTRFGALGRDTLVRFSLVTLRGNGAHGDCVQKVMRCARTRAETPAPHGLLAEAWFHRDPLAPLGAAARKNLLAALGPHAHAKSVLLGSLAPVGLECTLGHEKCVLLSRSTVLGQTVSINHRLQMRQARFAQKAATRKRVQQLDTFVGDLARPQPEAFPFTTGPFHQ